MIGLTIYCEKDKNMDKFYLMFFCLLFCAMAALRGEYIGNDTHAYMNLFRDVCQTSFADGVVLGRFEPGYLLINKFLSYISSNPQVVMFFSSVSFYIVLYHFIKKDAAKYCLVILLFFVYGQYRFSINALRQLLAITILISGMCFLRQKKHFLIYILFIALAYSIHSSAVIAGILYLLAAFAWKKKVYIAVAISTIAITLLGSLFQLIVTSSWGYSRYLGSMYDDGVNIASICLILMNLFSFVIIHFSYEKNESKDMYYRMTFIRGCVLIASLRLNLIDRLAEYFTLFEILGVSNALCRYKNANLKFWFVMAVVGIHMSYEYIWGVLRPNIQMTWPYKTFWM